MTTARPRARKKLSPARHPKTARSMADIWQRTGLLVEVLLGVMEREIHAGGERSEQWERLFGTKDSAVVTLQKLVQVLAELQTRAGHEPQAEALVEPVNEEELALLREWLAGPSAPNVAAEDAPLAPATGPEDRR